MRPTWVALRSTSAALRSRAHDELIPVLRSTFKGDLLPIASVQCHYESILRSTSKRDLLSRDLLSVTIDFQVLVSDL